MLTFFITLFVAFAIVWALAYHSASALTWSVALGIGLLVGSATGAIGGVIAGMLWLAFIAFAVIANTKALRVGLLSSPIFATYKKLLPQMSSTEQEALEAGTVWWDGDLFSGKPDWNKWLAVPRATLSAEEQAFVDGPTNELCSMLDEWNITHEAHDLPPNVWQFIKDHGFLGMIIPKEYGGKGFSAYGTARW